MSGLEFVSSDAPITSNLVYKASRIKPEHLFHTTVYNLEVEDFHTYYVGKAGMWVHNKLSTVTAPRKVGDQVFPAPGGYILPKNHNIPVYQGKGEVYGALNKEGAEINSGIILVPAKSDSQTLEAVANAVEENAIVDLLAISRNRPVSA